MNKARPSRRALRRVALKHQGSHRFASGDSRGPPECFSWSYFSLIPHFGLTENNFFPCVTLSVTFPGEDPFNEQGMSFEEAPAKVAKKTMEERMAFVTKDDVSKQTEMKEFMDKSGNKVFLEVAVQDKSSEELEALAWRDRKLMDEAIANPPNMDSFYMNPFTFR
jgi:hypothetical protein